MKTALLAPPLLVRENFRDSNSVSLDAHEPDTGNNSDWTEQSGEWDIQGNDANCVSLIAATALATLDTKKSDLDAHAILRIPTAASGASVGLAFRVLDTINFWYIVLSPGSTFDIYEANDNVFTQRATAPFAHALDTDYTLRVALRGEQYIAAIDGGPELRYQDTTRFLMTQTRHGLYSDTVAGARIRQLWLSTPGKLLR